MTNEMIGLSIFFAIVSLFVVLMIYFAVRLYLNDVRRYGKEATLRAWCPKYLGWTDYMFNKLTKELNPNDGFSSDRKQPKILNRFYTISILLVLFAAVGLAFFFGPSEMNRGAVN